MKIISVSSLLYYVSDPAKTQEFYEKLGFQFDKSKDTIITYVNWFSIEFRRTEGRTATNSGERVNIKVDNIDELYQRVQSNKIECEGGPKDIGGGVKEVTISDPDGYKLVFFSKK